MPRLAGVRIRVFVSAELWAHMSEDKIPADDDEAGWCKFTDDLRVTVRNARAYRDEQMAIRDARRSNK